TLLRDDRQAVALAVAPGVALRRSGTHPAPGRPGRVGRGAGGSTHMQARFTRAPAGSRVLGLVVGDIQPHQRRITCLRSSALPTLRGAAVAVGASAPATGPTRSARAIGR